jgi:raffinose/stachyose/melibiose transport system permease protein
MASSTTIASHTNALEPAVIARRAGRRRPPRRRRRTSRRTPLGLKLSIGLSILPGVALFAVFILTPLVIVVATSFSEWDAFDRRFTGLDNYRRLVDDSVFWRSFANTTLYATAGILIQVPLGVAVGMVLASQIRGWRVMRAVLFTPVVISGAAFALIFANFYNPRYGLLNWVLGRFGIEGADWLFDTNTALAAIAGTFVFNIGLIMVLVMTEVTAIPVEILDAARVDGASPLQRQLHIVLPLLRHVTGTCVLLSLLSTLAFFDIVYILTSGGPGDATVTLAVYAFRQYTAGQWGYANAIGVIIVATGFLLILTIRRLFRLGTRDL